MSHKILCVDDEKALLLVLKALLERYEVVSIQDSAEAQALLEDTTQNLDLLISDVRMRPVNGLDLAARARAVRPDLPIIMITAYQDDAAKERAENEIGVVAYLFKPFDPGELLVTVAEALARNPVAEDLVD